MDEVKQWVALICLTAISSAFFIAVLPKGKMKLAFSTLCGAIIICAVISPLSTFSIDDFDFSITPGDTKRLEEEYKKANEEKTIEIIERSFEKVIYAELNQKKLPCKSVNVKCNQNDDNAQIENIKVYILHNQTAYMADIRKAIADICPGVQIDFEVGGVNG